MHAPNATHIAQVNASCYTCECVMSFM